MAYDLSRVEPYRALKHGESDSTARSNNRKLLQLYLGLTKKSRALQFVTTARASKITGLSQRTIQFWVQVGHVDALFIGRKWLVCVKSLVEYLEDQADQHELL